jgi:PTS system galactitol-specific IIA component
MLAIMRLSDGGSADGRHVRIGPHTTGSTLPAREVAPKEKPVPPALVPCIGLDVHSADEVIRALSRELRRTGAVKDSFEGAALARERRSPTGLPFEGGAVALPHAEPEHVLSPALAVATLVRPVRFREMGSPGVSLEVTLVVMPAFTAKEQASAGLTRVIEILRNAPLRAALAAARDDAAVRSLFVTAGAL